MTKTMLEKTNAWPEDKPPRGSLDNQKPSQACDSDSLSSSWSLAMEKRNVGVK
ncbi:hypothetical protein SAY86_028530 [Trapa natans]|uniref:Uncharacterized protein n=1 Tax=Trapa natans TaxID=22666 RepID=A0AAN7R8Q2_TRANT|nr:hypothetical protein SAY86_028530 [Trapa natans]